MTSLDFAVIEGGEFVRKGLKAVRNVSRGLSYYVCAPKWGADPTGTEDSTPAFKAIFDDIRANYDKGHRGATVYVDPGTYLIEPGVLDIPGRTVVIGSPKNTIFLPTKVPAGGYSVPTALFSIGSWLAPTGGDAGDPYRMRSGLEGIVIKGVYKYDWQAQSGIVKNLTGVLFNTNLSKTPQNPDAYHHLSNIEIWDVDFGILIIGQDDQGMKVENVHIDRTLSAGMIIGRPPEHPQQISSSGADNHFVNVDVHGCNKNGSYAGIEVYSSNCVFVACKVWYVQRTIADITTTGKDATHADPYWRQRDGAGWFVRGARNRLIGCEGQETGGSCFVLAHERLQVIGCSADSASVYTQAGVKNTDGTKTSTLSETAPGFYISNWCHDLAMAGCQVYSMHGAGQNKWGYYFESWCDRLSVTGCRANDLSDMSLAMRLPSEFKYTGDIYIQVNNKIITDHVTTKPTIASTPANA